MADIQPSNNDLRSNQQQSGQVFCDECGNRFEDVNSLCLHIEYEHKHLLPKWHPQYQQYQQVPHSSAPPLHNHLQGFQPYIVNTEPNFIKSEPNFSNEPQNIFLKNEQDSFKSENNFEAEPSRYIKSEPNFVNSDNHFNKPDNNFIKRDPKFTVKNNSEQEEFPQKYSNPPPAQSPHNIHPDFNNGFQNPNSGFRSKREEILDLDSQRVHIYQPPPPTKPSTKHRPPSASQPPIDDAYVSTTTMTPPDPNDISNLEQPYPRQEETTPKSGNWKSNEPRRPKTYLCEACNKWFTSSGHLKRHYNTTLHKNAVKQSGQPDPCTLPVSAHHHPYRDPNISLPGPNGKPPKIPKPRVSKNVSLNLNGSPIPEQLTPEVHPPQQLIPSPAQVPTPCQSQTYRESQFSPKVEQADSSFPSPTVVKDSSFLLNNNYSQDPPNLIAGPSVNSEGLLPTPLPTSHYQQTSMPQTTYQALPTSIQTQNFLPLTANYPNFQAPHVSSTQQGTNINPIGNQNVLGQHVNEKAFIPLLMQASRNQLLNLTSQDANVIIQFQRNMSQHFALNIHEEYVGGLTSPDDLDYSTTETNPDASVTFRNDNPNISSTSFGNYSFQSDQTNESAFSPDSGSFSVNCSINNNNNNNNNNESFDKCPKKTLKPIPGLISFKQKMCPEDNSCNIITSSNGISNDINPLSPLLLPADGKPYRKVPKLHCDDCNKVFNKSCYLKQHNRWFHSGEKPFKCLRCGKRFVDELLREKHMTKHNGEKPHKCELCPKQFHHKTDLRRHLYIHSGGMKPHLCPTCSRGFVRKDHMLKHTLIHKRKDAAILGLSDIEISLMT